MNDGSHKVVITLMSEGDSPDVIVGINYDPPLTGEQVQALGYLPESFAMVEEFILPALEKALDEAEYAEDLSAPENRSIN